MRRKTIKPKRLEIRNIGQIKHADVHFGDLTVLVGPQATGKSIFLQLLKLLIDRAHIHRTFIRYNINVNGDMKAFLDGYFGEGMHSLYTSESEIKVDDEVVKLGDYSRSSKKRNPKELLFFVPAQRVVSLRDGQTQNFGQFNFGDPYALRAFSDAVHDLLQNQLAGKGDEIFPQANRLNPTLRDSIEKHLYGGANLQVDSSKDYTKRLVLNVPGTGAGTKGLPFLAWSAGQREFTPLLLGMYWLCPVATARRQSIEWVVIEELEMGLHPHAIATVLLLVLELLRRGYRVVISTHSPVVLDMIWALRVFKESGGTDADVRKLFELPLGLQSKALGKTALEKNYGVYYFQRDGKVSDISKLDPGSESLSEADWGGLSGFASRASESVAEVVSRPKSKTRRLSKRRSKSSEIKE